jgi:hypothetical protein
MTGNEAAGFAHQTCSAAFIPDDPTPAAYDHHLSTPRSADSNRASASNEANLAIQPQGERHQLGIVDDGDRNIGLNFEGGLESSTFLGVVAAMGPYADSVDGRAFYQLMHQAD